jgi:putative methionine-R-sulfoxide reductase with GAF domain
MAELTPFYSGLLIEAKALIEGETNYSANTSNIASLVYHELNKHKDGKINWVGFYFIGTA